MFIRSDARCFQMAPLIFFISLFFIGKYQATEPNQSEQEKILKIIHEIHKLFTKLVMDGYMTPCDKNTADQMHIWSELINKQSLRTSDFGKKNNIQRAIMKLNLLLNHLDYVDPY
ncbi:hypothetical protein M153_11200014601 [Pseudoloma neurophilia]|uniref:Uncharacterized protein n=1 Tax=Pseudoloma neurophilia TaxID=146866 RepID=A0A0R0M682_9MICR|nr:hypothetical protein M153_11200014601 [Pseudoloma neurophilia]